MTFLQSAIDYHTALSPAQVRFLLRAKSETVKANGRERVTARVLSRRNLIQFFAPDAGKQGYRITEAGVIVLQYAAMMALRAAYE